MVNTIKKRIVIRIDESLRIPEHEAFELIKKTLPTEIGVANIFFDPALGEAVMFAKRPSLISKDNDDLVNFG